MHSLVSKPIVIGKGAELKILNSKVLLKDSHEKANTPVFIEIRGKGTLLIQEYLHGIRL